MADPKILEPIFDLFPVLCISQLCIIWILDLHIPALLKDETMKITCVSIHWKKILQGHSTLLTFSSETKTGFDKRIRQRRIDSVPLVFVRS